MKTAVDLTQLEGCVVSGRFRLLSCLGGSEVSAVYLTAFESNPPRMAALKLVPASEPDAEGRLAGWTAAARLSHPNLIGIIDCGRCELDRCKFVYQVTDYGDEVLSEVLQGRPLSADEAREMLQPVLKALAYLHAQGYVHGRLKPSNILVVNDRLRLSGDSIALADDAGTVSAETGTFDAPEMSRGAVTPAADVWSLGMTLVTALTQKPARWEPWTGQEPRIPAGIAEPFGEVAKACLRTDPAERCTLDRINAILEPTLDSGVEYRSVPLVAARGPAESDAPEQSKRAVSLKAALIALAAVVVVAGAALTIRKMESSANAKKDTQQQASRSDSTATTVPQAAIEKPSPSGRSEQAAPETKVNAAPIPAPRPASVSRDAESSEVLLRVNPEVQPGAQKSIRGEVNVGVRATVDAAGNVTDAEVESPSGSTYFNRLAVDAARQWKFAAGAGSAWRVQFQFRQDGTDLRATRE
jgi:TonB family protein